MAKNDDPSGVKRWAALQFERCKQERGMTQADLGAALGISQPQARALLYGPRRIKADEIPALERLFGEAFVPASGQVIASVPILDMVSAGALRNEPMPDDVVGYLPVAGLRDGDWIALRVDGTSMDRISPPESIILVNRRDKTLVHNACYVIEDANDGVTYKRFRTEPPRFEPVSTFDHPTIFFEQEPRIIGRVRRTILDM